MGNTVTLRIRESIWYGRARSQPPPTELEIQLPEEGTFVLAFHSDRHAFAVTKIGTDAVELSPVENPPALVNEDGGIGPGVMAADTRLAVGQSLKVGSWTLDAGAIWEITVQDIRT